MSHDHDGIQTKKIKKENEYIKFYKFYFEKYSKDHPRWTTNQKTDIISLMWKKKKITNKGKFTNKSI
jgi:hypothetical protein